jgi:hypothetical protein
MRINLVTPFAEKDAVKALGARWDPAKKVWYIRDVTDLTPFARWIPDLAQATDDGVATAAPRTPARAAPVAARSPARNAPPLNVPHCGCEVLPWVACEHSKGR